MTVFSQALPETTSFRCSVVFSHRSWHKKKVPGCLLTFFFFSLLLFSSLIHTHPYPSLSFLTYFFPFSFLLFFLSLALRTTSSSCLRSAVGATLQLAFLSSHVLSRTKLDRHLPQQTIDLSLCHSIHLCLLSFGYPWSDCPPGRRPQGRKYPLHKRQVRLHPQPCGTE